MIVALGDLMLDIVMRSETVVQPGSHCFAEAHVSPGGSAANFAVWAARLGAEVGLIAKVGDDLLGQALLRDLEREGIQNGVVVGKEPTGLTLALEGEFDRPTMLAARGAVSTLQSRDLDWSLLDRADLLHVTAYSFFEDTPREAALAAMRRVKACGKLLSLDPSAHGYVRSVGREAFLSLAKGVDLFFPNLDEGRALTGEREPQRVMHALLRSFPVVAMKMGEAGAMAGAADTILHHPGFPVPVVDTTGAGDAFAAAFVVYWLAHRALAAALREGNRIAAGVVQVAGSRGFKEARPDSSPLP
jgi:sugar/nucleoside kinase (ribokinase family)